jgi:hypothetical protein
MKNATRDVASNRVAAIGSLLVLTLGLGGGGFAAATVAEHAANFEQVPSFSTLGGLDSFHVLDRETLIVWAHRSRPYLVELAVPSFDLDFTHRIGIRSRSDRIYAGFDAVIVDGWSYPIRRIYKLSRDDATALKADAKAARGE